MLTLSLEKCQLEFNFFIWSEKFVQFVHLLEQIAPNFIIIIVDLQEKHRNKYFAHCFDFSVGLNRVSTKSDSSLNSPSKLKFQLDSK